MFVSKDRQTALYVMSDDLYMEIHKICECLQGMWGPNCVIPVYKRDGMVC